MVRTASTMALKVVLVCLLLTTITTSATLPCRCKSFPRSDGKNVAYCANRDLTEVPPCVPNDTTILEFSGNIVNELNSNLTARMPALRQLNVDRSHIMNVSVNAFSLTPELRKIKLSHNNINEMPAGVFDATPLLEVVDLSGNMLKSLPGGLFKKVSQLKKLELTSNYLSTLPGDLLGGCGEQAILRVGSNHLSTLPAALISSCPSMAELDASKNGMTVLPMDVVAAIGQMSHLWSLRLHENPWHCDCALSPLVELLRTHDALDRQLTCGGPEAVKELHVVHVVSELDCAAPVGTSRPATHALQRGNPSAGPTTSVAAIVVVAGVATCGAIAAVAAFFTVRYRRKAADKIDLLANENA